MGKRLTDDEVQNLMNGRPLDYKPPAPNAPPPGGGSKADPPSQPTDPASEPWGERALESVGAAAKSFGKEVIRASGIQPTDKVHIPGYGDIPAPFALGKRLKDWSESPDDPNHPQAAAAGWKAERIAEDVAPYAAAAATPEVGFAKMLPGALGRIAPALEGSTRGAVGGVAANPKDPVAGGLTGAVLGGSAGQVRSELAALAARYPVVQQAMKGLAGAAGLGAGGMAVQQLHSGGQGMWPLHYASYHLIHPLAALAAALFGNPGLVGAAGEKALEYYGQERQPPQGQ